MTKLTINELIENLKSQERQIIILRFYKNKTQSEVGKLLRYITSTSIKD